jgi:hypothetical protein
LSGVQQDSSMASLKPVESALRGEDADILATWITRFTVLDSAHCLRITRAASRVASAVLLCCTAYQSARELDEMCIHGKGTAPLLRPSAAEKSH